jgi:hypothetical protein
MSQVPEEFVSISKAAAMLGLNTYFTKGLVDRRELNSWLSKGGHRRISVKSIQSYVARAGMSESASAPRQTSLKAMVAIESLAVRTCVQDMGVAGVRGVQLNLMDSVADALVELSIDEPDLLIVELLMSWEQQQKILNTLTSFCRKQPRVLIFAATNQPHLQALFTQNHPTNLSIVNEVLTADWVMGCVHGVRLARHH